MCRQRVDRSNSNYNYNFLVLICVHICLLFNMFIKFNYLPNEFMQSIIVPIVKSKNDDLSDSNNYRAIAISTAVSLLL